MILANSAAGDWGREHGVALIHRTQDITLPGDAAGVWTSPEDAHRVVRLMAPTCQELTPRRHATIGAEAYAPLTSPLRRYADLVNMAQMIHVLEHGAPLWDAEELGRVLPHLTARTEAAGRIQRFRPRYWKLVYFRQNRKEQFEAVAVEDGQLVTLALPREQLYVRVPRQMLGDKIYPASASSSACTRSTRWPTSCAWPRPGSSSPGGPPRLPAGLQPAPAPLRQRAPGCPGAAKNRGCLRWRGQPRFCTRPTRNALEGNGVARLGQEGLHVRRVAQQGFDLAAPFAAQLAVHVHQPQPPGPGWRAKAMAPATVPCPGVSASRA
jgi:hypothetical protein